MKLVTVFIIFCLFRVGWQHHVAKLIERIITYENIENIVFLKISQVVPDWLPKDIPKNIPWVVFNKGDSEEFNKEIGKILHKNLFFIVCCDVEEATLSETIQLLREFRQSAKGLFISDNNSSDFRKFFQWCWENGFLDALLWTQLHPDTLFRYEQFPNFRFWKIQDVTTDKLFNSHRQLKNLNGHPVRTPLFNEPPRVITYFNEMTNKTVFGGYCYDLLFNFIKLKNGTLSRLDIENYDMKAFINKAVARELDISAHPYYPGTNYSISSPIFYYRYGIMVPVEGQLASNLYGIAPFENMVWLTILITFIYISIVSSFMDFLVSKSLKCMESFCDVLLMFLNMAAEKTFKNRSLIILASRIMILAFVFILNNLYNAHLTTFLVSEVNVRQVETLEELFTKDIKVLTSESKIVSDVVGQENFEKHFVKVSYFELKQYRENLRNTSIAYTGTEEMIKFLFKQQQKMKRPNFYFLKECVTTIPLGLFMALESPFLQPFNHYLQRTLQAGLISKWRDNAFKHKIGEYSLNISMEDDQEGYRPLNVFDLEFAWILLLIGYGSAVLVFAGSWLFYAYKKFLEGKKRLRGGHRTRRFSFRLDDF